MAQVRVFVGSVHEALADARTAIRSLIVACGYEPVLHEYGGIPYDPSRDFVKSCEREVELCDLFVLIIGHHSGSPASGTPRAHPTSFDERFVSFTEREYRAAVKAHLPIYVLIESNVFAEYVIFTRDPDNFSIPYAVDSIVVFDMINKTETCPRYIYSRLDEATDWLKRQWIGRFKGLLDKERSALSQRGRKNTPSARKRGRTATPSSARPEAASALLRNNSFYQFLVEDHSVPERVFRNALEMATSVDDFIGFIDRGIGVLEPTKELTRATLRDRVVCDNLNEARRIVGAGPLTGC